MEKNDFIETVGRTELEPGTKNINDSEMNKLCNEIANDAMVLIINKIKHIEPRGMFNVAINASIYLLTSMFTNLLVQALHPKDHDKFKESVVKQVSDNLSKVMENYGKNKK